MDPKLKSDFPIDWEEDGFVSRREFFKFLTFASGGLAISSVGIAAWSKLKRNYREFEPKFIKNYDSMIARKPYLFNYPRDNDPCILIKRFDGELVAYSQRCTHLSCPVQYKEDKDILYCPCHNGAFSIKDGSVIQGPPPRPLPQVILEIKENEVWAIGIKMSEEKF